MIQMRRVTVIPDFMQIRVLSPQAAAAAAAGWWLSGGISAGDCYCAYQPKGAASLAARYSNLNNPGTNDAGVGVAPTWGAATGWVFNGTTQYLTTTFVPASDQSQSVIVQFTNGRITIFNLLCGCSEDADSRLFLMNCTGGTNLVSYANGISSNGSAEIAAGNMAVAGNQGYLNGTPDGGAIPTYVGGVTYPLHIGRLNRASPTYGIAYIQAFAIYDTTLTAPQVAAVSAAMAAL